MNIKFSKDKLDLLLKKFDKKIADFVKSTYSSKEQKNKAVQIHKLLNPKINAPKYYTENNLSGDLANWFNKMKDDKDLPIDSTFFLEQQSQIKVIGAQFNDARIELFKTGVFKKILVNFKYSDCIAIINKTRFSNGTIKIFKSIKQSNDIAENSLCIAQDKKTKIIYFGYIEPIANSKYNILDISASTGNVVGTIIGNVSLSWSSKQETVIPSSEDGLL
tara:strand:+ start:29 stop:685 length:657 start_codon:yes stop_codon:yes gene_type:complete